MSLRSTIAEEGENGGGFGFLQRKNRKNRLNIPGRFAGGVDGGDDGVDGADDAEEEDMDGTDMLSCLATTFLADRGIPLSSSSVSFVLCSVDDSPPCMVATLITKVRNYILGIHLCSTYVSTQSSLESCMLIVAIASLVDDLHAPTLVAKRQHPHLIVIAIGSINYTER